MKKIFSAALTAIFTLAAAASAQAQNTFFLDKKGAEAEYVMKDAKGAPTSYVKTVVTDVKSVDAQNFTITYTTEVSDKNRNSMVAPVTATVEVKNGAVNMAPVMEGVELEGTFPSFPSDISVGQVMEYSFSMKMMGMKTTTTGKNTVAAKENVATEAGTFDCYKIDGETSVKAMMQNTKAKTVSWIAAGVGAVKTEIYDGKGNLQTTQELVSLKR